MQKSNILVFKLNPYTKQNFDSLSLFFFFWNLWEMYFNMNMFLIVELKLYVGLFPLDIQFKLLEKHGFGDLIW